MRLDFTIPKALWLTSNRQIANRGYRQRIVGDLPCERCVFVPTPDGKCICRGAAS